MKSSENLTLQAQDFYDTIISKCRENDDFKKRLIANPQKTLNQEGIKAELPSGFNFKVTEQTEPNTIYINIPLNPNNLELTDEMLASVNGGFLTLLIGYFSPQAVGARHAMADNETYGCG